jgi:CHAT domain-containing protein
MQRDRLKLLFGGLTEAVQGFPPLPNVGTEAETVHQLYEGALLLNDSFVIRRLEQELSAAPFTVVHIASHSEFHGAVERTFLLTFEDRLTMNRLDQLVGSFRFRDPPLELLTLSACQTAAGDDRAALGLAGVAVKAGAKSALATLWYINDQATADLVIEFYRQMQDPIVSKAVALQRAQLALLRQPRYQHPAYWSPFLLINNWM